MSVPLEGTRRAFAREPGPRAPQRWGRAVQYPRRAPEVNQAAGGPLLHLVTEGNLEPGRSVPLHVRGGWAPGPLVALEACRFPPGFLALLPAHPRRRLLELREEKHGGARAEQRGRGEPPAAALPAQGVAAAAVQGISRDLHHCGCLHESADFHGPKLATAAAGGSVATSDRGDSLTPSGRAGGSPLLRCGAARARRARRSPSHCRGRRW